MQLGRSSVLTPTTNPNPNSVLRPRAGSHATGAITPSIHCQSPHACHNDDFPTMGDFTRSRTNSILNTQTPPLAVQGRPPPGPIQPEGSILARSRNVTNVRFGKPGGIRGCASNMNGGVRAQFSIRPMGAGAGGIMAAASALGVSPSIRRVSSLAAAPKLAPLIPLENARVLAVKVVSNWGSPDVLRLGTIEVLDEEKRPVTLLAVKTIPKLEGGGGLEKLMNEKLVKTVDESWTTKWPPNEECSTITFGLFIAPECEPRYLRMWNAHQIDEAAVKEIIVIDGNDEIARGEIPMTFGADMELAKKAEDAVVNVATELFPELVPEKRLADQWGDYPLPKVKDMTIEIFSNWGDDISIGINGIAIYDHEDRRMKWDDVDDMICQGCGKVVSCGCMFRDDKRSVASNDQWVAAVNWSSRRPKLTVKFEEPKWLSKIVIYNFNALDMDRNKGIKDIRILINEKCWWVGRCQQGSGHIADLDNVATTVWITDMPEIKQRCNHGRRSSYLDDDVSSDSDE